MTATPIEAVIREEVLVGTPAPRRLWRRATKSIDRVIGFVVEPLAGMAIVAEVCILASGVFLRYVLHNALPWTDELATYLLL
jgi:TRAP-type C4-dicarboxylate transport system permease small subunit